MRFAVLVAAVIGVLPLIVAQQPPQRLVDTDSDSSSDSDSDIEHARKSVSHAQFHGERLDIDVDYDKRDWHIGCDEPGKCDYYQDQHSLDRRDAADDLDTRDAQHTCNEGKCKWHCRFDGYCRPNSEFPMRCQPGGGRVIEKLGIDQNGKTGWTTHYQCPISSACFGLPKQLSACALGNGEYLMPSLGRLVLTKCTNPFKYNSCERYDKSSRAFRGIGQAANNSKTHDVKYQCNNHVCPWPCEDDGNCWPVQFPSRASHGLDRREIAQAADEPNTRDTMRHHHCKDDDRCRWHCEKFGGYCWPHNDFSTRCEIGGGNLIEKAIRNPTSYKWEWVPHRECPGQSSCINIKTRFGQKAGACALDRHHRFLLPSRNALLLYKCDDVDDLKTCKPIDKSFVRRGDLDLKPVDTAENPDTRDILGHHRCIDTDRCHWHCKFDKHCYPNADFPMRCKPGDSTIIEKLVELPEVGKYEWQEYQECLNGACVELGGQLSGCALNHPYRYDLPSLNRFLPYKCKHGPQDLEHCKLIVRKSSRRDDLGSKPVENAVSFRCAPGLQDIVQYHHMETDAWVDLWQCSDGGICEDKASQTWCSTDGKTHYVAPFLDPSNPERPVSLPSPPSLRIGMKMLFGDVEIPCDPPGKGRGVVTYRDGKMWNHQCRRTCWYLNNSIMCKVLGDRSVASESQHLAAHNSSRPNGELHDTSPLRTKCNTLNETEVGEWDGQTWTFSGVCLPPFICHDYGGKVDFAFCAQRKLSQSNVWLPWPSLSAPTEQGVMTRCPASDKGAVERFNGANWVRYQHCPPGFKCQQIHTEPHNAGCMALHVDQIKSMLAANADTQRRAILGDGIDQYTANATAGIGAEHGEAEITGDGSLLDHWEGRDD
ncbi:hypothetical protein CC80DRAFT_25907 [Byssothecium circinans]|uniref:C3H1-type domain-containing protein n=1 Tax=Byssothecium circinans TaxID=147558 RepID=A0A6A5TZX2_9PLEO|nr:hypothetical protein CC80DRAFT_25907 [Byssothecium circinans]